MKKENQHETQEFYSKINVKKKRLKKIDWHAHRNILTEGTRTNSNAREEKKIILSKFTQSLYNQFSFTEFKNLLKKNRKKHLCTYYYFNFKLKFKYL